MSNYFDFNLSEAQYSIAIKQELRSIPRELSSLISRSIEFESFMCRSVSV
jgi:hypothetical protein